MTDAEKAIREALADPALFDEGASVDDTLRAALAADTQEQPK